MTAYEMLRSLVGSEDVYKDQELAKAHAGMEPQPARITLLADREQHIAALHAHPVDNALVLIKGSRGIGLEKAVGELYPRRHDPPGTNPVQARYAGTKCRRTNRKGTPHRQKNTD